VIDKEGVFGKDQVGNNSLTGLDNNWKGKTVIWVNIEEYAKITQA